MNWLSNPDVRSVVWLALSFALSLVCTALAIRYARRNNVVDQPGQRRSHSVPTPRGGGIGIVIAVLAGLVAQPLLDATPILVRLLAAIALIALIGWIDDHRPLPAWSRLLVQAIAVAIWLMPLLRAIVLPPSQAGAPLDTAPAETAGFALLLALLVLWSINLHNFMDGIDGLLATQAIFVLSAMAWLGTREAHSAHPLQLGMWAAAIAAFLPFNFPRARVFMGDVGSGVIGLLIAVAVVWQTSMPEVAAASGFIAASAFVIDATCTLLSRMLGGRRWYRAHREHLYQWLTRSGMSHARVVAIYMGWNLLVVTPLLWWINGVHEISEDDVLSMASGTTWAIGVYALGAVLWICGKRWCLRRMRGTANTDIAHAPA